MNGKPKFEDLAPDEINDLIAIEIMGWRKAGIHYIRSDKEPYTRQWFPYSDLNDCHLAEERLSSDEKRSYCNELYPHGLSNPTSITFRVAHATSQQKCEALLRAKGLVE